MRRLAMLSLLLASTQAYAADDVLFNGKDLKGWTAQLGRPDSPKKIEDVWTVKDGAIMCIGGQRNGGWLHTEKDYTNFVLTLEYRWGEIDPAVKAAGGNIYNSGIFFRSNPRPDPDQWVPFYYQSQIINTPSRDSGEKGGGTGDIWLIGYDHPNFKGETPEAPRMQMPAGGGGGRPARPMPAGFAGSHEFPRMKFAEKPIGEWNKYVITVDHDKLTYVLNGEVVNRGTGAGEVAGKIGLECENTPILFRNITVKPLK